MKHKKRGYNPPKVNLALDAAIFVAFLVATAPQFTGIAIHEWLSIAFGATIVAHLLLHWQWLAATTRRFFSRPMRQQRVNYVLNALLFISVTVILFTGLLISEVALPLFGIRAPREGAWRTLHALSSDASVILIGLHVALHWRWIVGTLNRFIARPVVTRLRPARLAPAAAGAPKESQP
jgi:hypothetical protein